MMDHLGARQPAGSQPAGCGAVAGGGNPAARPASARLGPPRSRRRCCGNGRGGRRNGGGAGRDEAARVRRPLISSSAFSGLSVTPSLAIYIIHSPSLDMFKDRLDAALRDEI